MPDDRRMNDDWSGFADGDSGVPIHHPTPTISVSAFQKRELWRSHKPYKSRQEPVDTKYILMVKLALLAEQCVPDTANALDALELLVGLAMEEYDRLQEVQGNDARRDF